LDEPFNAWIIAGTVLVLSGVYWVTRPSDRKP
jgi:drug/metabolite transporter (DMT)-like permease